MVSPSITISATIALLKDSDSSGMDHIPYPRHIRRVMVILSCILTLDSNPTYPKD